MKRFLAIAFCLLPSAFCPAEQPATGSIWPGEFKEVKQSFAVPAGLFSDRVANHVGDLITIVVNLTTDAVKKQQTATAKQNTVNDVLTTLLYPNTYMGGPYDWYRFRNDNASTTQSYPPTMVWSANQAFAGNGKAENQETLTTTIEARVVDISPNGVMQIEARRTFKAADENTDLVLVGYVRREDVGRDNTVQSTQVANLQIVQETNGAISRSQKKGWLTKLYEIVSPF